MLLTPAETNTLIGHLVADINAARFVTILQNNFNMKPERFTDSPDFKIQMEATFEAAESENWIANLLAALYTDLSDDTHAGKCAGDLMYSHCGGVGLQTLLKASDVYEANLFAKRMLLITGQVCLIQIDGNAAGTGVLVGADTVLTAFHVVEPLIHNDKADTDSQGRLTCRFDFVINQMLDGTLQVFHGVQHGAAVDWLGPHSEEHPFEKLQKAPPVDGPIDKLDYALIKLADRVGDMPSADSARRGWVVLRKPPKSLKRFAWIRIVQYPAGQAIKGAEGRITQILSHGARLQYYVSTANASSGSPCWTLDFDLVAIHNLGGVATPAGLENQGVPIGPIIDHIVKNFGADKISPPPPAAAPGVPPPPTAPGVVSTAQSLSGSRRVWSLGAGYPVLNRVQLQGALEGMLQAEGGQLLSIRGSRYSGRSFSVRIAQQFLGRIGHTVVALSAISLIDAGPEEFILELRSLLGMGPATFPVGADLSTRASLIQRHLLTGFLVELRETFPARAGDYPLVWIFIDALDQASLKNETDDLLAALTQRLAEVPALRLVLIGYERELAPEVDSTTALETIATVTAADVETHIRYLCERALVAMPPDKARELADHVIASEPADPASRLKNIALAVQRIGQSLQEAGSRGN